MVVDHKLSVSIGVKIDHGNVVSAEDEGVIDSLLLDKGTIHSRDTHHADGLIEEVGSEDDDLVLVFGKSSNFDTDISTVAKNVLCPGLSGVKAFLGVFEPEKLSITCFSIGTSSDEILAAISIEINPVSHVIEVFDLVNLLGDSNSLNSLGKIFGVHANDVHATVTFAWNEETIGHKDSALTENIKGDGLDVVWPFKVGGIKLDSLEIVCATGNNGVFDTFDHVDVA